MHCSIAMPLKEEEADLLRNLGLRHLPTHLNAAQGCAKCDGEGYRGRVGVNELLVIDDALAEAIRSGAQEEILRDLAIGSGMVSMMGDALIKVVAGITTLDEVIRVVPPSKRRNLACKQCDQLLSPAFQFCPKCATPVPSLANSGEALSPVPNLPPLSETSTRPN